MNSAWDVKQTLALQKCAIMSGTETANMSFDNLLSNTQAIK